MARLKWVQALCMTIACLVPRGDEQPANPPFTPYGRSAPTASGETVSLSVQPLRDGATTRLRIRWSGQEPDSTLVVSLHGEHFHWGAREIVPQTALLHSGFLFRRIDARGETTVTLDNKTATERFGGPRLLVCARVIDDISLTVSPRGKRSPRSVPMTTRQWTVKGENAPSEFHFPCSEDRCASLSRLYPEHDAMIVENVHDLASVGAVISYLHLSADIRLLIQLPEM